MRVTAEVDGELRELAGERADAIRDVVEAREAHVAGEQDGVGLGGGDLAQKAAQGLDRIDHLEAGEVFRRQPGRERRGGGAEHGEADAGDFLDEPRADFCERSGGEAERLALDTGVAGENGHR